MGNSAPSREYTPAGAKTEAQFKNKVGRNECQGDVYLLPAKPVMALDLSSAITIL